MSDADLERIRNQRMAQMQSQFVSEFQCFYPLLFSHRQHNLLSCVYCR